MSVADPSSTPPPTYVQAKLLQAKWMEDSEQADAEKIIGMYGEAIEGMERYVQARTPG
jgi:hypothetical protein